MSVCLSMRLAYRIGGLDDQVDEQLLLAVFVPFGEVKEERRPQAPRKAAPAAGEQRHGAAAGERRGERAPQTGAAPEKREFARSEGTQRPEGRRDAQGGRRFGDRRTEGGEGRSQGAGQRGQRPAAAGQGQRGARPQAPAAAFEAPKGKNAGTRGKSSQKNGYPLSRRYQKRFH